MVDLIGQPPQDNVLLFKSKDIVITLHDGKHWTCALDMLKELVNDIEHGRCEAPDVIYVAMQTRHPKKPELVAYPSCCWSDSRSNGLIMQGLLAKHTYQVNTTR